MGTAKIDVNTLIHDTLIIDICASIKEIVTKRITYGVDAGMKLREDFKAMLENPINSDVSLHVDNERISAHWSVLCSRSPYFKRMFDSQMKERVQNSITITDISASTLKNLIKFLYSAYFFDNDKSNNIEELFDLYYGADKYEVIDLKALCACKIKNNVTADNVCKILLLAHRHNDEDLEREAMDFIHLNSDAVFQSDGWKKFKASEPLAAELCSFFCLKKN
ncbi:speckle-type POZ protein-like [Argiope bruennichi]|nr:speckle-type POZ protein-like [Argiope bruennichi]